VFTTFFALGVLLISLFPRGIQLKTIIQGNILGISDGDLLQLVIISAITLIALGLKWRDLVLYSFDASHARVVGLNAPLLHFLLLAMLSLMTVAALQAVGASLVAATLITPGATAYLLTDRFGKMLGIAAGIGAGASFAGAYASYFLNGSTGGCIVVAQTLCFFIALIFAPRHGLLASRRARRKALKGIAA
jgi:manganese/iron transport system permease protein